MANFVTTVLVVYCILLGVLYVFQRRILFVPNVDTPDPIAAGVAEMQPVELQTADGLTLLAWYRPPQDDRSPVLVYFHGNAGHIGFRGSKMRSYLDSGYGILLPEYRGYGGNAGAPSEDGLYADARAALSYLDKAGIDGDRLVLYGESLGTGVAVKMAAERAAHMPVGAVVLEAPFTSIASVAQGRYFFLPVYWLVKDRFDAEALIDKIAAPLFVFHGEDDRIISISYGRALFASAGEPKEAKWIPRARHNDLYDFGVAKDVVDFIERRLNGRSG